MKYRCLRCEKTLGGFAADNHSADGHGILAQPDPAGLRPPRSRKYGRRGRKGAAKAAAADRA